MIDKKTFQAYLLQSPSKKVQYGTSIVVIALIVLLGLIIHDFVGYRVIALLLLMGISVLAIFLDILPVLLSAVLSALLWDLLFIPPTFTLIINNAEDQLLLLMYFIVALINAVLTYKIKQAQKEVQKKEAKVNEVKFYNSLFNSLSHELRTPITTIIGATDSLLSLPAKLTDKDRHELISEISTAGIRLNQQVENLLNMSRLEAGFLNVKKDWVDINELVHQTLNKLENTLVNFKVVVLLPHNLPLVQLDSGLMEHVLYNLISNATIHTPQHSTITIQAEIVDDNLVLKIADNGPGFPQQEIDSVFNKFYRLQSAKTGGTGLGLSITRGFVEAHGGKIILENLPVCGAKFTIEIPTKTSYLAGLKNE